MLFTLLANDLTQLGFVLTCVGSLLLLVQNYGSSPEKDFIPHTALGILLLVIAVLLAYAGWIL